MNKAKTGSRGEVEAARYLRENGYRILAANYRCRLGEIDIIAENDVHSVPGCAGLIKDITTVGKIIYAFGVPVDFCQTGAAAKSIITYTSYAVADCYRLDFRFG